MQEGCRHKHEIPQDEETRTKIGMRGIPRWLLDDPVEFGKHWPSAQKAAVHGSQAQHGGNMPHFKRESPDFTFNASPKRRRPSSSPYSYEHYQGHEGSGGLEDGEVAPGYAPGHSRERR